MKHVILVGDGMGDYPVKALDGRTPLQAARMPACRRLAAAGRVVMMRTVADGFAPGSDVANLGLLGYDARDSYTGRAPIEAAGAGIAMAPDDVAFRCNLVTLRDGVMADYSAGHITTEEAHAIMDALNRALGRDGFRFHGGVSYRHLLVWKGGPADLLTEPPHEISDEPVAGHLPRGGRAAEVVAVMEAARGELADHPVNRARRAAGRPEGTDIWLWGQGPAMALAPFASRFGLRGGVVSAVDLVRGLGILAGLEAPRVPGATGFLDTNTQGKVDAATDILSRGDFAYVHLEAPDECGHLGDAARKVEAIEMFDARIVAPVWEWLEARGEPYRLAVTMDHRTPVSLKGHTAEPVPMILVDGPTGKVDAEAPFDEFVHDGHADAYSFDLIRDWLSG